MTEYDIFEKDRFSKFERIMKNFNLNRDANLGNNFKFILNICGIPEKSWVLTPRNSHCGQAGLGADPIYARISVCHTNLRKSVCPSESEQKTI